LDLDREFVELQTTFYDPYEDKYYQFSRSVEEDEHDVENLFPLEKKFVRGKIHFNIYCFSRMKDNKGTKIAQVNQVDIKGSIPKFLVNKLVPTGANDFLGCLDKALKV
jgi:hypothetical protein